MYEHLKYETPTGDLKRDMWGISGTIPMGGGLWYVYYGNAGDGKGGASDSESRINSLVHGSDSGSELRNRLSLRPVEAHQPERRLRV